MGGFGSAVGDILSKAGRALEGSGTDISKFLRGSKIGTVVDDSTGAKDAFFRMNGDSGKALGDMHKVFQEARSRQEKALDVPLKTINQGLTDQPELSRLGKKAKLTDFQQKAQNLGHTPTLQAIQTLLSRDPGHADRTLEQILIANTNKARVLASAEAFGPKMENIIPYIMKAYDSGDPIQKDWANQAMNLISNETHDTKTTITAGGGKIPVSGAKDTIAKAFNQANKVRSLLDEKELDLPNVEPTTTPVSDFERKVIGGLRTVQLPEVALKHLSTILNLSSIHANDLVRGLMGMSDASFKNFRDASAILAFTEHDILHAELMGRLGKVAKWSSSPSAGELFYKSYHMPFFSTLRRFQLTLTASVGYHSAQDWAYKAMQGNKRAAMELEEMGLDLKEIQKNGGQLTPEQLTKAMFHFTNNRMFMDKSVERSMLGNRNGFMRSATMYHTFVNAQQRFIRRELGKMFRSGDIVGIAQFAGTIGILFPMLAPMIKSFELLGRTMNPALAEKEMEKDYQGLTNPKDAWDFTGTYLDMLAQFGAMGVYHSYVAAANGNRLANTVMGAGAGTFVRNGQDLLNAITQRNSNGKHNWAPVGRDLLEDTVPIVGNIAAHKFFPTRKEEKEQGISTSRSRRITTRRRRKP